MEARQPDARAERVVDALLFPLMLDGGNRHGASYGYLPLGCEGANQRAACEAACDRDPAYRLGYSEHKRRASFGGSPCGLVALRIPEHSSHELSGEPGVVQARDAAGVFLVRHLPIPAERVCQLHLLG